MLLVVAGAAAGMTGLWSLIMGDMGIVKYSRMRAQERSLRAEIAHLKQDNLRLLQEVRALKHDPAYLERLARDKIGLARPGEIVYYYGDPGSR
jgi:cell division protein FtsB